MPEETEESPSHIIKFSELKSKAGLPKAFSERCVIRNVGHTFKPNSKGNPMVTVSWELVGWFPPLEGGKSGPLTDVAVRSGVRYIIGGLNLKDDYFVLSMPNHQERWQKFWNGAHPGETLEELDITNPGTEFMTDLLMEAIVSGRSEPYRRKLSEEEQNERKAKGLSPQGEAILGADGKPIEIPTIQVSAYLIKYTGELPEDAAPY